MGRGRTPIAPPSARGLLQRRLAHPLPDGFTLCLFGGDQQGVYTSPLAASADYSVFLHLHGVSIASRQEPPPRYPVAVKIAGGRGKRTCPRNLFFRYTSYNLTFLHITIHDFCASCDWWISPDEQMTEGEWRDCLCTALLMRCSRLRASLKRGYSTLLDPASEQH